MKKSLFVIVLMLAFGFNAQAQNDSAPNSTEKYNEIKVNSFFLLLSAVEVAYERNISEESSVGVSVFVPFKNEDIDYNINYYISPYYRVFFGKKYAAGFFLEGFGMLNSTDQRSLNTSSPDPVFVDESVTDFALGFGLGGKWMTSGGFVFEVSAGIGRNLFNSNEDNDNDTNLVGKFGFNLGYRF